MSNSEIAQLRGIDAVEEDALKVQHAQRWGVERLAEDEAIAAEFDTQELQIQPRTRSEGINQRARHYAAPFRVDRVDLCQVGLREHHLVVAHLAAGLEDERHELRALKKAVCRRDRGQNTEIPRPDLGKGDDNVPPLVADVRSRGNPTE